MLELTDNTLYLIIRRVKTHTSKPPPVLVGFGSHCAASFSGRPDRPGTPRVAHVHATTERCRVIERVVIACRRENRYLGETYRRESPGSVVAFDCATRGSKNTTRFNGLRVALWVTVFRFYHYELRRCAVSFHTGTWSRRGDRFSTLFGFRR